MKTMTITERTRKAMVSIRRIAHRPPDAVMHVRGLEPHAGPRGSLSLWHLEDRNNRHMCWMSWLNRSTEHLQRDSDSENVWLLVRLRC